MSRTLALALSLGLGITACGGGGGAPRSALDAYRSALRNHDYGKAYDMMTAAYRNSVSREDFVRMMKENPREVKQTVDRLGDDRAQLDVSAEVRYGLGDTLDLVQQGGRWYIATNPMDFYDRSTPRAALRSFVRAYRLERWDVMLRLAPKEYRDQMDVAQIKAQFQGPKKEELEILVDMLEGNLGQEIVETGATALMRYGETKAVKFRREDGEWLIEDL